MSTVNADHSVLLVGGTGRTGRRVLAQLLERGVPVRAIVRSAARLPEGVADHPLLTVVEADLLALSAEELQKHLEGCDTVISCLGHNTSLKGILGPPFDLVTRAVSNLTEAAEALRPAKPVRLILMSTVSVMRPAHADTIRGSAQRLFLWALRGVLPPARDNQSAADACADRIGTENRFVEWVVVRPDSLLEGDVTEYRLSEALVSSIFKADGTNMANVAHVMCELTTEVDAWRRWRAKMPVIVNAATTKA